MSQALQERRTRDTPSARSRCPMWSGCGRCSTRRSAAGLQPSRRSLWAGRRRSTSRSRMMPERDRGGAARRREGRRQHRAHLERADDHRRAQGARRRASSASAPAASDASVRDACLSRSTPTTSRRSSRTACCGSACPSASRWNGAGSGEVVAHGAARRDRSLSGGGVPHLFGLAKSVFAGARGWKRRAGARGARARPPLPRRGRR